MSEKKFKIVLAVKLFPVNLLGFDTYISEKVMEKYNVKKVDLDEIIATSDFISIHTPLTDETRNMFSDEQFKKMKDSAFTMVKARNPTSYPPLQTACLW